MIGMSEMVRQVHPPFPELLREGVLSGLSMEEIRPDHATRRQEHRVSDQRICTYTLCESIDETGGVIQEGEAFIVNRSQHGVLLLLGYSPNLKQILELHVPESNWRGSLNLYEVQWSKPISVPSRGDLYFVGCRLMFGPSRYWTF